MESDKTGDFFVPKVGNLSVLLWLAYFCQVNLLDRIKEKQVIADVLGHLKIRIGSYRQTKDIMAIFKWKLKIVP